MTSKPRTVKKNKTLLTGLIAGLGLLLSTHSLAADNSFRERLHQQVMKQTIHADVEAEIEFGRNIAARVLGRYPLLDNPELNRYISLVGTQLANLSGRSELSFRFAILDSEHINAYSAPGGYVFISRGAIQAMQDEAELAAVLAHEIAHISERHIIKAAKIKAEDRSSTSTLSRILGGQGNTARIAFSQAVDKAVETLFSSGYQQADELDSDRVATLLLASTGYDPLALKNYLQRVQAADGEHSQSHQTTHPPSEQRMQALEQLITEEQFASLPSKKFKQRFDRHVSHLN